MLGDNQIKEINGLERLSNLQILDLESNPIRSDEIFLVDRDAQDVVNYFQEKQKS